MTEDINCIFDRFLKIKYKRYINNLRVNFDSAVAKVALRIGCAP